MKELTVIKNSIGIDLAKSSTRLAYDDEGFNLLEAAVNVDVTDGLCLVRRNGFKLTLDVDAHSVYSYNGVIYCVINGSICRVSGTLQPIRTGVGAAKVYWVGVGDKVFYSNGLVNGFIHKDIDYAWVSPKYIGPTSTDDKSKPPSGKWLCHRVGRIFVAEGNTLWYTNPLDYLTVNKASGFLQFDSPIITAVASRNILLVATANKVYTITGNSVDEFELTTVDCDRLIEGSTAVGANLTILGKNIPGEVIIFTTPTGIYTVSPSGEINEVTNGRVKLPAVTKGCAYVHHNTYTVLFN